jgi:hypothetical protein
VCVVFRWDYFLIDVIYSDDRFTISLHDELVVLKFVGIRTWHVLGFYQLRIQLFCLWIKFRDDFSVNFFAICDLLIA